MSLWTVIRILELACKCRADHHSKRRGRQRRDPLSVQIVRKDVANKRLNIRQTPAVPQYSRIPNNPIPDPRPTSCREPTLIDTRPVMFKMSGFVSNAGLVYLLSRRPPCSRFAFGIYVAADAQAGVIQELERAQPDVIVWGNASSWSRIDGYDLRRRTQILAAWIEAHFPVRTKIGSYELLSVTALKR